MFFDSVEILIFRMSLFSWEVVSQMRGGERFFTQGVFSLLFTIYLEALKFCELLMGLRLVFYCVSNGPAR